MEMSVFTVWPVIDQFDAMHTVYIIDIWILSESQRLISKKSYESENTVISGHAFPRTALIAIPVILKTGLSIFPFFHFRIKPKAFFSTIQIPFKAILTSILGKQKS